MRCQSVLPLCRLRHVSTRSCVASTQATTNTQSFQTIGEAWPLPGVGIFHTRLSPVSPFQRTGTLESRLVPSPRGPRQPGQFSPLAAIVETATETPTQNTQHHCNIRRFLSSS